MNRSEWKLEKSEVFSRDGVVCAHHLAGAEAGAEMLERGGNAVDAAVAAAFAVGVAEPFNSGVGGIAQLLYREAATGRAMVFDGTSVLPRSIRPDMFPLADSRGAAGMYGWPAVVDDLNNTGWLTPAVPGMPACMLAALERFGRLPRREILAPSIRLAADGVPVDWNLALAISSNADRIRQFSATREIFFRASGMPRTTASFSGPGDELRQPDLANTLQSLADEGADALYRGELSRRIANQMAQHGGLIDRDDLASYRVRIFDDGVTVAYRDHQVTVAPETGGGLTVAQALRLLEGVPLSSLGYQSVAAVHYIAEAQRRVFTDRFRFLGDPSLVAVPYAGLLDRGYAATRLESIDPNRASRVVEPGNPWDFQEGRSAIQAENGGTPPDVGHTTHISVVDRDRNLVSLTSTLGDVFGSGVVVPGTGILLNCGTTWFDPRPGSHNSIAPGRRILWAGSPSIVTRRGEPFAAVGAPGGRKVISSVLQVLLNLIDFRLGIQDAVAAPRVHCEGPTVFADSRLPTEVLDGLREIGHDLIVQAETISTSYFGRPNGVLVDRDTGRLSGGVSPFKPYYAIGL